MSLVDNSPQKVAIFSVYRQGNMLPSGASQPIIRHQIFIAPYIFWRITKVEGTENQFYIQDFIHKSYLTPGGERNSCILSDQKFAWQIVLAGGAVNLYNISEPSKPENLLQPGFQVADNAFDVLSKEGGDSTLVLWIIEKPPNNLACR